MFSTASFSFSFDSSALRLNGDNAGARNTLNGAAQGATSEGQREAPDMRTIKTTRANCHTFPDIRDKWLAATEHRPSWRREVLGILGLSETAEESPLANVPDYPTREELRAILGQIRSASRFNKAKAILSAIYNFGDAENLCVVNPLGKVKKRKVASRERTLSLAELRAIWTATGDGSDFDRIVRLLILTGCRADEVASLSWPEVDRDDCLIRLPSERTKNKLPHLIALTQLAIGQLPKWRDGYPFLFGTRKAAGFSGWTKEKAKLDARSGVTNWKLHDIRRTFVTLLNERAREFGADAELVELAVNHISGHKANVAGVYNKAERLEDRREMLIKWAGFCAAGFPSKAQVRALAEAQAQAA